MNRTIQSTASCMARFAVLALLVSIGLLVSAAAQECEMGNDVDPATKSAIDHAAQQYFQMAQQNNVSGLQQNAIPLLAGDISGVRSAIQENQANLTNATATTRNLYSLQLTNAASSGRAEFFCGIFNSPDHVSFVIPGLSPGNYAVVVEDVKGGKSPMMMSFVLQNTGGAWKLAGFYPKATEIGGHDGSWYLSQARQYKQSGQLHNAWFYYLIAWDLSAPVQFMYPAAKEKIADEMQQSRPADLPGEQPMNLAAAAHPYSVTQMFPVEYNGGLYLVVKYRVPQLGSNGDMFNDNVAAMKALLAKYPEYRSAFAGIVARAVAPSGQDYGTPMAMNKIS